MFRFQPAHSINAFPTHIQLHNFGDPAGIILHLPAHSAADAANIAAAIHQLPSGHEPIDITCRARDSLTSIIATDTLEVVELFDADAGLLWKRGLGLIAGPG